MNDELGVDAPPVTMTDIFDCGLDLDNPEDYQEALNLLHTAAMDRGFEEIMRVLEQAMERMEEVAP